MIAEGVEEESQLRALKEMGCECGQGFLVGEPSDAREILARLTREAANPPVGGRHGVVAAAFPSARRAVRCECRAGTAGRWGASAKAPAHRCR